MTYSVICRSPGIERERAHASERESAERARERVQRERERERRESERESARASQLAREIWLHLDIYPLMHTSQFIYPKRRYEVSR
jgi:hypothetical protein